MLEFFRTLLSSDRLAPHGYCLLWQPELIWTHVAADAAIGTAYLSIPVALGSFLSQRPDVRFGWVVWLFVLFITACGLTHFFSIVTLWQPYYGFEALVKALTAIASVVTAVALWPLIPKAIALPSPAQLQRAHDDALARVEERDAALDALRRETDERVRAEEMLRQAQKMEAVGQLSGGIAHDFNNMLTVVLTSLERVKRLAPDDAPLLRALDHATLGAQRCADLTDRLLSFARKQPLQAEVHDPNVIVGATQRLLQGTLGERIRLDVQLSEAAWPIRVDRNQLENALVNLAVNAQHAMPNGGTLRISVSNVANDERHLGEWVQIEVADTGVGMSSAVLERAFEPFFTTKPVGEGTGLGLSQVYGFISQSSGHVAIESELGRGTVVRLLLPRVIA